MARKRHVRVLIRPLRGLGHSSSKSKTTGKWVNPKPIAIPVTTKPIINLKPNDKESMFDKNPKKLKQSNLNIGSWNIKRGLVTKEIEPCDMLNKEDFDILFLNETDSKQVLTSADYQIKGYETILPKISSDNKAIRMLCLVKSKLMEAVKICDELMSEKFPSIWLELKLAGMKKTIIGGCYREWNRNGLDSISDQVKRINILCDQFDKATLLTNRIIILGDMNLCSRKWNQDKFKDKSVADILKNSLVENGLTCRLLGDTFSSDIIQPNGKIAIIYSMFAFIKVTLVT